MPQQHHRKGKAGFLALKTALFAFCSKTPPVPCASPFSFRSIHTADYSAQLPAAVRLQLPFCRSETLAGRSSGAEPVRCGSSTGGGHRPCCGWPSSCSALSCGLSFAGETEILFPKPVAVSSRCHSPPTVDIHSKPGRCFQAEAGAAAGGASRRRHGLRTPLRRSLANMPLVAS